MCGTKTIVIDPPSINEQVNAYYGPTFNSLHIPLGILNYPMYQKDRLPVLNFASIGAIVGHEMTHGFDNNGALFDKKGDLEVGEGAGRF